MTTASRLVLSVPVLVALAAACAPSARPADDPGGGGDPGGGSGGNPDTDPGGDACERIEVHARPQVSNVLVVLDRSSSMFCDNPSFCSPTVDRWTPAVDAVTEFTGSFDERIRFGLMLFANPDAPAGQTLCGAGKVDVPVAYQQGAAIGGALAGAPGDKTGSWTPTADSLAAAGAWLNASGLDGARYLLLVTDGAPNCNAGLSGASCTCVGSDPASCASQPKLCLDDKRTVQVIEDLAAQGVHTFVVGYDTSAWAGVLDAMASAGQTGYTQHFEVGSAAGLASALESIAGGLASCTFELETPPGDVVYVRVTVDGQSIPHESKHPAGPGHGWRLVGDRTVELIGPDCAHLRDGAEHAVTVIRECEPVID